MAYFCMEYGLDNSLPIYAGGLGILAGDVLKAARDENMPLVGIGLLWRQGYTSQRIEEGRPVDSYPRHDHIYDLVDDTGVRVSVDIRGREVICSVYRAGDFGNADLYLLDANHPANEAGDAWLTGQLYGWFSEERIAQEMILGIGGVRALRALNIDVDVYHFNEGHAALAGTELIEEKRAGGAGFDEALKNTREEVIFTTHTPVEQGNEEHSLRTLSYMGAFNGLSLDEMVQIGGAPFNMTVAGLRLSSLANGVSQLHGKTARRMWEDVDDRAPIKAITNGVHRGSWVDEEVVSAWREDEGPSVAAEHAKNKAELLDFITEQTGQKLAEERLLLGFARRAVPYKRATLLFSDEERIGPYLEEGKIQIVYAGKAHPLDDNGKDIVAELVKMSRRYPEAVVFLPDYDMEIGRLLTRGVDVWLNNPRRPLEASGTSGMKAAMNGIPNLSILDGWWPEACQHGVNGWKIGDGFEADTAQKQDEHDLKKLYRVLLEEVLPLYYEEPGEFARIRENSIASTIDKFTAAEMMKNYYDRLYSQNQRRSAERMG